MFWWILKHLTSGALKFENGFILLARQRMVFIGDSVLFCAQKSWEKEFGKQNGAYFVYNFFKNGAKIIPSKLKERMGIQKSSAVEWMIRCATAGGWGKIKLVDLDDKRAIFSIKKSPFVEHAGVSEYPVCNVTRGLIAGTLSGVLKEEIEGVERECGAVTGRDECIMVFQPSDEWKKVETPDLRKAAEWQLPDLFKARKTSVKGQ